MNLNLLLLNLQILLLFFQPLQLQMNLNFLLLNLQIHYSVRGLIEKEFFKNLTVMMVMMNNKVFIQHYIKEL